MKIKLSSKINTDEKIIIGTLLLTSFITKETIIKEFGKNIHSILLILTIFLILSSFIKIHIEKNEKINYNPILNLITIDKKRKNDKKI